MYTTKIEQQTQVLFFVALSLALFGTLYKLSFWPGHGFLAECIALLGLFLVLCRFIAVLYSMPIKYTLIVIFMCPFILYTCTQVHEKTYILYPFLFCVSAWNVNFRSIIKVFFLINLVFLFVTIASSLIGIIENKSYFREEMNLVDAVQTQRLRVRYCFGYNYTTAVAAHITYLHLMWWYLRGGVLKYFDYFALILSICFVDYYCHARTEVGCMILIILFSIYYKYRVLQVNNLSWIEYVYFTFSVPFFAILTLFLEYQYIYGSDELYEYINIVLSGRLSLGADALLTKGIKWFGQIYIQHGAGSGVLYNFIDSSYLVWLIIYGKFFFISAIVLFVVICYKSLRLGHCLVAIIISILAIDSFIVSIFLTISFNPFFMAMFANMTDNLESASLNVKLLYA